MKFYDFNPKQDGTITVTVPIEDMGNGEGFISIQFGEEEIAFVVSERDDGEELYTVVYTHEDFCNFLEARAFWVMLTQQAKELDKTRRSHPASRNHLQIIDGGGNE